MTKYERKCGFSGRRWTRRMAISLIAASVVAAPASAQDYPSRRVTIVVPYGASSTNDIFGRIMAEGLSDELGQPVIVENKPGAGGTVGIGQVVRGEADGYTLAVISTSSVALNRALYTNLTYDPAKDLTPIAIPSTTPNALIVSADQNINTLEELIAKAKGLNPPRYNSAGSGTSQHLSAVLLSKVAGLNAEHVPYRGQEGITGMIGGQTLFGFASVPSVVGLVRGGKLKIVAMTGERPSSAFPEIPTFVSKGYPQFAYGEIWYGIGAPSGIPDAIKAKLSEALTKAVARPDIKERLAKAGFDPVPPMSKDERAQFIDRQVKFWGDLVKESGAKAD